MEFNEKLQELRKSKQLPHLQEPLALCRTGEKSRKYPTSFSSFSQERTLPDNGIIDIAFCRGQCYNETSHDQKYMKEA